MYSNWTGKKILAIGDSLTSQMGWQSKTAELLGAEIKTHANGGIGFIDMVDGQKGWGEYDNDTGVSALLPPLSIAEAGWADLILVFGGYNERHMEYGNTGDIYPVNDTLCGKVQYVIDKIYSLLESADNLGCRLAFITPHCVGKYDWIPVDGYGEYPSGSGRTLELLAENIKKVAAFNSLPCWDAFHESGINRYTWKYLSWSPVENNEAYSSDTYVNKSSSPYPQYADQVHLNYERGYPYFGERIAAFINTI